MSGASDVAVGAVVELEIGSIAHGGHMVARLGDERRVVFVRHALPGEVARVRITEESGSFLRGDAVEIVRPSSDRVEPPCPVAGPGLCGGCDFQHVDLTAQRRLKGEVVSEQLRRLAGIDRAVEVEAVPGDEHGLRWRSRMQYVALPGGQRGLRVHRSHEVIAIADCLLDSHAERPETSRGVVTETVRAAAGERAFQVDGDGFWQVHPGAAATLVDAVLEALAPQPGERALDLYAGVGLFAAYLANAVTSSGEVIAIESDRRASRHAATNLAGQPWVQIRGGRVDKELARGMEYGADAAVDVVVLDPPRAGAKRAVVQQIAARHPRAIAYVACDPAALARDLAYFADAGYELTSLRAFDLFPMTHHVECVALLTKTGSDLR